MKAVWTCVILLIALLLGVFGNARFIHQSEELLISAAEALKNEEQREAVLDDLESFWEEKRPWFSLSVSFRELDHFGEILSHLRWAHDESNESEFEKHRRLLEDVIEEITRTEQWSVENIF